MLLFHIGFTGEIGAVRLSQKAPAALHCIIVLQVRIHSDYRYWDSEISLRWKSEPLNNPLKFVDDSFGEIHHTLFEGDTDAPVLTFERFLCLLNTVKSPALTASRNATKLSFSE